MFRIAQRKGALLRLSLQAVSGGGKTYSSLLIAKALGAKRIGLVDSEKGSGLLYAQQPGIPPYLHAPLDAHDPDDYVRAINAAAAASIDALIIDSVSHAWQKTLEQVDAAGGWARAGKFATPKWSRLINSLLSYPGHVIATMRSRTEYALEKGETGKTSMKKLGLAPQMRNESEYEFTVALDLIAGGQVQVLKSRCVEILPVEQIFSRDELPERMKRVAAWLMAGGIAPADEALERLNFANDAETLAQAAAFIGQVKAQLTPEELKRCADLYLARKGQLVGAEEIPV